MGRLTQQTNNGGLVDYYTNDVLGQRTRHWINSYQQGTSGGSYTVRDGDSLAGIAAQLWGDASLWYKLAQANGLSGDAGLVAGQSLNVPAGVLRSGNTASTFRPYDVTEAYGDSSPTTPAPRAKNKNKCGAFGAILLVAIAVAVTVVSSGAILAATGAVQGGLGAGISAVLGVGGAAAGVSTGAFIGAGVAGAMIGSAASQGLGIALGIQDKFDWKGVALAGISAGVGGAMGAGGGLWQSIGRGALANAVTQGIGVATGLQPKFDWAGVAAAGMGAGVSSKIKLGGVGGTAMRSTASGLVNAATRSLINGTDFGGNLLAALPDVIGQTVGSWAAGRISGRGYDGANPDGVHQGSAIADGGSASAAGDWLVANRLGFWNDDRTAILLPPTADDIASSRLISTPSALNQADDIVVTVKRTAADRALAASGEFPGGVYESGYRYGQWVRDIAQYTDGYIRGNLSSYGEALGGNDAGWKAVSAAFKADLAGDDYGQRYALYATALAAGDGSSAVAGRWKTINQQIAFDRAREKAFLDASVDRPIAYGLGGIALGALTAGAGTAVLGGLGWTGGSAFAFNVGVDGLAVANTNLGLRAAAGGTTTLGSYGTDVAVGSLTSGVGRVVIAGGGIVANRIIGDGFVSATPQVTANQLAGNAFRDKIAGLLRAEGRDVSTEVYKSTPFGKRFIDIEVSMDGRVLGGIETKYGASRYRPAQRAKDWWLKANDGYIVNVVRDK